MNIAPLAAAPAVLPLARDLLAAARDTGIFLSRFQQSLEEGTQPAQPKQPASSEQLLARIQRLRARWSAILQQTSEGVLTPPFKLNVSGAGTLTVAGSFPATPAQRALLTDRDALRMLRHIGRATGNGVTLVIQPNSVGGLRIVAEMAETRAA